VYGVQTDDFRSGASALAAAPFKVYEHLLWAALLIVASAVMAWFAGGAFRRARPWLSSGLSVMAIGLAAGGAYWIVEQWAGDTLFPPGSVNGQVLYMSTRAFMIQFFIGFALLAVFAVLTIAGVATADRPVGYHLAVLNWMIVAVVWTLAYLGLYLTPSLLSSG
jgi:heme/copper-type cytochrome/quinol oxidase subunit 3